MSLVVGRDIGVTGVIDQPMDGRPSTTLYQTLGRLVVPLAVGKYDSARYSLVRLEPLTGRFHQVSESE